MLLPNSSLPFEFLSIGLFILKKKQKWECTCSPPCRQTYWRGFFLCFVLFYFSYFGETRSFILLLWFRLSSLHLGTALETGIWTDCLVLKKVNNDSEKTFLVSFDLWASDTPSPIINLCVDWLLERSRETQYVSGNQETITLWWNSNQANSSMIQIRYLWEQAT